MEVFCESGKALYTQCFNYSKALETLYASLGFSEAANQDKVMHSCCDNNLWIVFATAAHNFEFELCINSRWTCSFSQDTRS
jgi:hypothetical protein